MDRVNLRQILYRLINIYLLLNAIFDATQGEYTRAVLFGSFAIYFIYHDYKNYLKIRRKSIPVFKNEIQKPIKYKKHHFFRKYINSHWNDPYLRYQSEQVNSILEPGETGEKKVLIMGINDPRELEVLYLKLQNQKLRALIFKKLTNQDFLLSLLVNHSQNDYIDIDHILDTINSQEFYEALLDLDHKPFENRIFQRLTNQITIFKIMKEIIQEKRKINVNSIKNLLTNFKDSNLSLDLIYSQLIFFKRYPQKASIHVNYNLVKNLSLDMKLKLLRDIQSQNYYQGHDKVLALVDSILRELPDDIVLEEVNLIMKTTDPKNPKFGRLLAAIAQRLKDDLPNDMKRVIILNGFTSTFSQNTLRDLIFSLTPEGNQEFFKVLITQYDHHFNVNFIPKIKDHSFLRSILFDEKEIYDKYRPEITDIIDLPTPEVHKLIDKYTDLVKLKSNSPPSKRLSSSSMHVATTNRSSNHGFYTELLSKLIIKLDDLELMRHYVSDSSLPVKLRLDLVERIADNNLVTELLLHEFDRVDEDILSNTFVLSKVGEEVLAIPFKEYTGSGKGVATSYSDPSSVTLVKSLLSSVKNLDDLNRMVGKLSLQRSHKQLEKELYKSLNFILTSWTNDEVEATFYLEKYRPLVYIFKKYMIAQITQSISVSDWQRLEYPTINLEQRYSGLFTQSPFKRQTYHILLDISEDWQEWRFVLPLVEDQDDVMKFYEKAVDNPISNLERKILAIRNMDYNIHKQFLEDLVYSPAPYVLRCEALYRIQNRDTMISLIHLPDDPQKREEANQFVKRYECMCNDRFYYIFNLDLRILALNKLAVDGDFDLLHDLKRSVKDQKVLKAIDSKISQLI